MSILAYNIVTWPRTSSLDIFFPYQFIPWKSCSWCCWGTASDGGSRLAGCSQGYSGFS